MTLLPVSMDSALLDMSYKRHHIIWAAKYFQLIFSGSMLPDTQRGFTEEASEPARAYLGGDARACARWAAARSGAPGLPLVCLARGSRPRTVL